ncbi:succinylglutamate desuccinylase [Synergistales bacterium]|nr:succinylglutamate desuccinylase [Synergistales bacterium]
MDLNFKGNKTTACLLLGAALVICAISGREFMANAGFDDLVPAAGFERKMLSDYFDGLRGSRMDTPVFVQNGAKSGGSVLILGGTHPNEPSGYVSATLFLENARVVKGRLFVIPFANASGFTNTLPQEASPSRIHITRSDGSARSFRYGSRDTSPIDMWPTPDIYIHKSSGQELAGNESKNLNRAYPGDPNGTPVERLAYGIMELLRGEKITLAFDLHEASPEYPVVEAIVAHERSMELAAATAMELIGQEIDMRLEPSPKNLHGLSHREWGDYTDTLPILMETANPSQGRLRGRTDETLALTGLDKAYAKAAALGRLFVPYGPDGKPLSQRVARHVASISAFLEMLSLFDEENGVTVENVPGYEDIIQKGVGSYLGGIGRSN